jgi:hypothetical protein
MYTGWPRVIVTPVSFLAVNRTRSAVPPTTVIVVPEIRRSVLESSVGARERLPLPMNREEVVRLANLPSPRLASMTLRLGLVPPIVEVLLGLHVSTGGSPDDKRKAFDRETSVY